MQLKRLDPWRLELPRSGSMLVPATVYASERLRIESESVKQLAAAASVPSVVQALATPDIHVGFGVPIGCVMATEHVVVPAAVGYDVNCGMRLLSTPLARTDVEALRAGDRVALSGTVYAARDAAHARLAALLAGGAPLPFPLEGQVIYYVGPTPAPPGMPIGAAGPTTSGRMDPYTPALLAAGLRGMIGKGSRSAEVREAMVRHKAVYFAATGGAGALLARRIRSAEVVAWEELGPEAVRRLVVEEFPLIVINDVHGNDLYEQATALFRAELP